MSKDKHKPIIKFPSSRMQYFNDEESGTSNNATNLLRALFGVAKNTTPEFSRYASRLHIGAETNFDGRSPLTFDLNMGGTTFEQSDSTQQDPTDSVEPREDAEVIEARTRFLEMISKENREFEEKNEKLTQKNAELTEAKEAVEKARDESEAKKEEVAKLNIEIQLNLKKEQEAKELLQKEKTELEQSVEQLKQTQESLESEKDKLTEVNKSLQNKLEEANVNNEKVVKDNSEANALAVKAQTESNKLKEEKAALQSGKEELEQNVAELRKAQQSLESANQKLSEEKKLVESQLQENQLKNNRLTSGNEDLNKQVQSMTQEKEELTKASQELTEAKKRLEQNVERLQADMDGHQKQASEASTFTVKAQTELKEEKEANASLQKQVAELTANLELANQPQQESEASKKLTEENAQLKATQTKAAQELLAKKLLAEKAAHAASVHATFGMLTFVGFEGLKLLATRGTLSETSPLFHPAAKLCLSLGMGVASHYLAKNTSQDNTFGMFGYMSSCARASQSSTLIAYILEYVSIDTMQAINIVPVLVTLGATATTWIDNRINASAAEGVSIQ